MDLGSALQQALKAESITSVWLRRMADAPWAAADLDYDCALLDVSLPDGSGLELLKRWRQTGVNLPIIMITARSGLDDRLEGLDSGADDFIVKPFAMAELISRVRAVLRRYAQQASAHWNIGDLRIEPRAFRVWQGGVELDLVRREFELLIELAREPGTVVSKGVLAQRLEPLGEPLAFSLLEVHVSNLRRKIGANRIRTLRGIGYMLVV
ncbi:response regulator transcription factor [Undibacterium sp. LX40W]|uniref:Response regulator transcription factor n=1 Tax=Undibacterium nitidum TaxID=2762298 RepID=A0A923HST4_9BURK|nr:response regulator transcription factor [Undibacterium nitidum]MBC3882665.1 response regulator transcription factor [Undibacterium nitidum]MBC3892946.1 response regulator transcription factor [Undibacterium sp. LX40W]